MSKGISCFLLFASLAAAQLDQKTSNQNEIHDRGQTNVSRQTPEVRVSGMLFDAGCRDRSPLNVTSRPESLTSALPAQPAAPPNAAVSRGIDVNSKTLEGERADVVQHQVRDLLTRQQDPSCAITGGTSGYAVRLDDGRILNLDEGGNTLAGEAVLGSNDGRAMLNGTAYGFKPRVTIAGHIRGDRIFVNQISAH